jgi:hypothetical protein
MLRRFLVIAGVALTALALPSSQAEAQSTAPSIITCDPFSEQGGELVSCDLCDLVDTANNVIEILIAFLVAVGVLAIIIAGFRYVTSAGSSHMVETAKRNLYMAITGVIIALLAFAIIESVIRILGFTGPVFGQIECTVPTASSTAPPGLERPSPRPGQQPVGPGATGKYADFINESANKYGLPPCAVQSIVQRESSGNPNAVGHNHSKPWDDDYDPSKPLGGIDWDHQHDIGLMQVGIFSNKSTWRDSNTPSRKIGATYYTLEDLFEPRTAIDAGANYLSECVNKTGNYRDGFRCYNGSGPRAEAYADDVNKAFEQCLKESESTPQ